MFLLGTEEAGQEDHHGELQPGDSLHGLRHVQQVGHPSETVAGSVVNPDLNWILIQDLC